ncbi:prepilin peptidase [Microtetraspora niveoalba]|uniref:prepilin peptidase n=1 Tax=Microtetraspora niveoalba TaxID=46175 RepID=UPI0008337C39|nr:A24 family peptidase [Microtetraspora niveoalba]
MPVTAVAAACLAGAAGLVGSAVGAYARAFADGFGERPEAPVREARDAFARAARIPPLPRRPYVVEGVTAVVFGLVTWRAAGLTPDRWPDSGLEAVLEPGTAPAAGAGAGTGAGTTVFLVAMTAALLYAAAAGVTLSVIDWRTRRLPDAITLPSVPVLAVLLAPTGRLGAALLCGLALAAAYALLWFVRPAALGLGDVKLAVPVGMVTGAVGVDAVILAAVGAHVLGALYAVGLLVTGRATRTSEFPFGPFMLGAALLAVVLPVA